MGSGARPHSIHLVQRPVALNDAATHVHRRITHQGRVRVRQGLAALRRVTGSVQVIVGRAPLGLHVWAEIERPPILTHESTHSRRSLPIPAHTVLATVGIVRNIAIRRSTQVIVHTVSGRQDNARDSCVRFRRIVVHRAHKRGRSHQQGSAKHGGKKRCERHLHHTDSTRHQATEQRVTQCHEGHQDEKREIQAVTDDLNSFHDHAAHIQRVQDRRVSQADSGIGHARRQPTHSKPHISRRVRSRRQTKQDTNNLIRRHDTRVSGRLSLTW